VAGTDRVVLFFGDFREEKGILQLLTAVSDARAVVPNLKLVLVGGLVHPERCKLYAQGLREAFEKAHTEGFLVVVSNPGPLSVARLLRAADLAVFPFLNGASENRGSILAAIANETATLTTSGRSTPADFAKEFGVDVVPAGDVHALTSRIAELLLHPRQLAYLSQQSSRAGRMLSWGAIADRHIQIYRCLSAKS
jgi:glycosyltransferase involved in cell wall biosynthesis